MNREAYNRSARERASARRRAKAYGRWEPFWVDATPARSQVQAYAREGIGYRQIARLAGIHESTINTLLYGNPRNPPPTRIQATTAAAILAVRAVPEQLSGNTRVDATGTLRRLQALVAAGWSQPRLARHLGMRQPNFSTLMLHQDKVSLATVRAVIALYDELWNEPPPERCRAEKYAATRARNYARKRGWVVAGWWDDTPGPHCIDDPQARPAAGWRRRTAA